MPEIILKMISVALFSGLALSAIHLSKTARGEALRGLRLVRDGFLLAAGLSLLWLAPLETLDRNIVEIINIVTIIGVVAGLLFALRGLSRWYASPQEERRAAFRETQTLVETRDAKKANARSARFVHFVDSCLNWSATCQRMSNPHLLAETFLNLLTETIHIRNSALVMTTTTIEGAKLHPILLATSGIDDHFRDEALSKLLASHINGAKSGRLAVHGRTFRSSQTQVGDHDSASLILIRESERRSADNERKLAIGLRLFGAALQRQTVLRNLANVESTLGVTDCVRRAFKRSFLTISNSETGSAEFRILRILYETLVLCLRDLGSVLIPADFILVESSANDSAMTVSLTQADSSSQPRIGFYPYSRRLSFSSKMDVERASQEMDAVLIRELPVYDSRPVRQRIVDERLRSLMHGLLKINSQTEIVIVIGSRTADALGKPQRELFTLILAELRELVGYVVDSSARPASATWPVSSGARVAPSAYSSQRNESLRHPETAGAPVRQSSTVFSTN